MAFFSQWIVFKKAELLKAKSFQSNDAFHATFHKGDKVKISGPNQVEKCAAGDAAIGIAIADYDHDGKIPKAAANWGSYENTCYVRVATGARVIKTVQLESSNSAVSAGNYIKVGTTTAGCYDKSSSATDAIALEDASANSGAKIQVAFGVMNII